MFAVKLNKGIGNHLAALLVNIILVAANLFVEIAK